MAARAPAIPAQTVESLNEQEDILAVRNMRAQIVTALLKDDGSIPDDDKKLAALQATLNDMDRSALTRQRIKSEANKNDLTAGARAMVAEMLNSMSNNGTRTGAGAVVDAPARVLEIPDDIKPSRPIVEGETTIGANNTTFEEFSKKHMVRPADTAPEQVL